MSLTSRSVLLALAENGVLKPLLMRYGMSKGFVQRFVAGETQGNALATARTLEQAGIGTALDWLGEHVATAEEAYQATEAYIATLEAVGGAGLADVYLSIKLTALGLDLGETPAFDNLRRLLRAARTHGNTFVRVDMEGSAYTQRTLDIVRAAHQEFGNVGVVLQSYLYRTEEDVAQAIADRIPVRLVKGAYAEPPRIAYSRKADVDAAYVRQMRNLLLNGYRPAIATHDDVIIRAAKRFIRAHRLPNDGFEFQMLLGIRRDRQESLAAEGYHVRVYVPFGRTWYPYFMRRLAERPANLGFLIKNLLRP